MTGSSLSRSRCSSAANDVTATQVCPFQDFAGHWWNPRGSMVAHCISRIGHRGSLPQIGGGLTTTAILQTALKISSWTQVQSKSNPSPIQVQSNPSQSANCDQLNHAVSEPLHNQRCRHRSRVPATSRNWRRPHAAFTHQENSREKTAQDHRSIRTADGRRVDHQRRQSCLRRLSL